MMDEYGVGRAFMFCLDEPDRHPGFRAPNDRTLAYARESNGRLIPFVRLDLNEDPVAEANRVHRRGRARHQAPPARAEDLARGRAPDARVPARLRAQRADPHPRRPRPAADRGAPARARRALRGRAADHRARGHRRHGKPDRALRRLPGVFFDTSVWSAVDLLDFYRQMPPEQIVYASDYPYAPPAQLAADGGAHGAARGLRRVARSRNLLERQRHAHRERRAAARADAARRAATS